MIDEYTFFLVLHDVGYCMWRGTLSEGVILSEGVLYFSLCMVVDAVTKCSWAIMTKSRYCMLVLVK